MELTKYLLPALILIGISNARPENKNLDDILKEIANSRDTAPKATWQPENYPTCGTEKVCVPKFLCNKGDLLSDGRDIIDIRSKRSVGNTTVINGADCGYLETCCNIPNDTTILIPQLEKYPSCGTGKGCVPKFLCSNGDVNTDGRDIVDVSSKRYIPRDGCGYLATCCNIPHDTKDPPLTTVPNITLQQITVEESTTVSKTLDQNISCGYRNPDGVGFSISANSDSKTLFGEFPWMAAILREVEDIKLHVCGAALITPTVIVTAANCVQNQVVDDLIVRAGEWDIQTETEVLPHQDRRVRKIIIHENFDNGPLHNDIALVIVESPFEYQENIRSICLPPPNTNFDLSSCYATGWGKDKFDRKGKYQVILKKINLSVLPNSRCQANLRTTRLGKYFYLHESFICAGGELGQDTCKGDGGSPLVCPIAGKKNQFYQAGIVSWGIGCGEENIPGVYGNVAHLRSWINEKLSELEINFDYFTA